MAKEVTKSFTGVAILAIIAVCILTRLPQLFSPNLVLDEDECVVGLMAKHLAEGKGVSAFFWGQAYGFSLIETSIIAVFYRLLGFGDIAVKLAMLSLFIAGVVFFYKAIASLSSSRWLPLIVAMLFICNPAWAEWSMKARGGYLSAFLLNGIFLWLLFRKDKKWSAWVALGFIMALTFYCQPLWLPGLLCLLFCFLSEKKGWEKYAYLASGALPVIAVLEMVKRYTYTMWSPRVFTTKPNLRNAVMMLYDHLHGYTYLDDVFPAPLSTRIFAGSFIALALFLLSTAAYYCFTKFRNHRLFLFSVAAMSVTFFYSLFITGHPSRYLLPISGFVLLALFFFSRDSPYPKAITGIIGCYILAGVIAVISFKDFAFLPYSKKELLSTTDYLERQGLNYVFSNDVPQEWQIMFYSREQIICRESSNINRYPAYTKRVNEAYKISPAQTAVVDFSGDLKDMAPKKTVTIAKRFYVTLAPSARLLKDMDVKW
jgi:hypothetical protein